MEKREIEGLNQTLLGLELAKGLGYPISYKFETPMYEINNTVRPVHDIPNSLDAVRECEADTIEKVGWPKYYGALMSVGQDAYKHRKVFDVHEFLILSNARQRAQAALLALS